MNFTRGYLTAREVGRGKEESMDRRLAIWSFSGHGKRRRDVQKEGGKQGPVGRGRVGGKVRESTSSTIAGMKGI